jgi:hypothetical protein
MSSAIVFKLQCNQCKELKSDFSKGQLKKKDKRRCNVCIEAEEAEQKSVGSKNKLIFKAADMQALAEEGDRIRQVQVARSMLTSAFEIAEKELDEMENGTRAERSRSQLDCGFAIDLAHIHGFLRCAQLEAASKKDKLDRLALLCARKDVIRSKLPVDDDGDG